jgi:hypothetical protein
MGDDRESDEPTGNRRHCSMARIAKNTVVRQKLRHSRLLSDLLPRTVHSKFGLE